MPFSSSLIENLCLADRKFVSFAAHIFDQYGQMQFSAPGYLEAVGAVSLFHTEADICVQLTEQTVTQVAGSHVFPFLSGKRAVVDDELHGDGRFGNLLERNGFRIFRRAEGISDGNVGNTGNGNDGADGSFFYIYLVQTVKFIEFADA